VLIGGCTGQSICIF